MQVWGTGAFDNDAATAWVATFDRTATAARSVVTRAALSAALDRDDENVDFTALAAATTVAAGLPGGVLLSPGCGPVTLVDDPFSVSDDLAGLAAAALQHLGSPTSEWSRTWARFNRVDDARAVLDVVSAELEERSAPNLGVRAAS